MGSSTSKLKKKLKKGDESSALSLFDTNKDLQRKFDANISYGDRHNHDTPLHLAARHGMKRALRLFLFEYGGNPNKKNSRNESSLHCACQLRRGYSQIDLASHEECVNMLIEWRGSRIGDGSHEKLDIAAQDKVGNTALHYAAQSGFMSCVKLLVELNAPLFTENDLRQTPCELAEQASMYSIAQYLESKMVFYDNDEIERTITPEPVTDVPDTVQTPGSAVTTRGDNYLGLRPQELQEAKDTLIVETSDMLRVPLFTAEVLLRHHEWSREVLLEAWIQDPVSCCEKSGVAPPAHLNDNSNTTDHELNIMRASSSQKTFEPTSCGICFDDINEEDEGVAMLCEHQFCEPCWKDYLDIKIKEGDAHNIVCPAFDCNKLVPVEFIEKTVSTTMAQRYLQFDIKAFVASNPRIIWCPHPGCGQAVQNPDKTERNRSASVTSRTSQHSRTNQYQSLTAHCSNGHSFCWSCQLEPHDPATCDNYKSWIEKIVQMKKDEFADVTSKSEAAANVFWMLSNSKKCPNCKSPIEKNEGCNHMRCSKCKHDFCWVCLEPWKWHNSMTGGFFRCTRYEVVEKVDEQLQSEMTDASEKHKALQELNRFVHYFSRYENHKRSLELERPLLDKAKQKMSQLVDSHIQQQQSSSSPASSSHNMNTAKRLTAARFIEEAITVLIKSRQILQFGYVYGYYLQDTNIKKMVFELLQTELEEKTEYLSEIIARPYLRTPKAQIIKTTKQVSEKREEFLTAISNGLLPQDLPNVDTSHRSGIGGGGGGETSTSTTAWLSDSDDDSTDEPQSSSSSSSRRDVCKAENCRKPKLKHSGHSGEQHHDYCSVACLRADYLSRSKRKAKNQGKNRQIDLLQALEMSRLQLLQDMDSLNTTGSSSDVSVEDESASIRRNLGINVTELPPDPILEHVLRLSQSVYAAEQDEDLNLAIEMSMQSDDVQRRMLRERAESRRHRAHSHTESQDGTSQLSASNADNTEPQASTSHSLTSTEQEDRRRDSEIERELYRARLEELDNAIAELLETRPTTTTDTSLRRTESERDPSSTTSHTEPNRDSLVSVRRTRSERRQSHRQLSNE